MWFTKKNFINVLDAVIPEATPTPDVVSVPVASALSPTDELGELREEYIALAKELGMEDAPPLVSARLRALLAAENIHTFKRSEVYAYLNKQFPDGWFWRALRERDYAPFAAGNWNWEEVPIRSGPYSQAIPLPVLLTIKNLSSQMDGLCFFVNASDKEGDPFLMVTMGGRTDCFIIERWDEPSFRERGN